MKSLQGFKLKPRKVLREWDWTYEAGVEFSQTKQMLFSYIPKLYGLNRLLTSLKTELNQDENVGTWREHFLEKNCILLLFSFRLMFESGSNVLMELFHQENISPRHMLKEETMFMSWWRSVCKEV